MNRSLRLSLILLLVASPSWAGKNRVNAPPPPIEKANSGAEPTGPREEPPPAPPPSPRTEAPLPEGTAGKPVEKLLAEDVGAPAPRKDQPALFRNQPWGASMEDVIRAEGQPVERQSNSLAYHTRVAGKDAVAVFLFDESGLAAGVYMFALKHTERMLYVHDFRDIAEAMTQVYGPPNVETTEWLNNLYRDRPEDLGTAIAVGHVTLVKTWQMANTDIGLSCSGDNFKTKVGLVYQPVDKAYTRSDRTEGL